jgi:hypothetical protein
MVRVSCKAHLIKFCAQSDHILEIFEGVFAGEAIKYCWIDLPVATVSISNIRIAFTVIIRMRCLSVTVRLYVYFCISSDFLFSTFVTDNTETPNEQVPPPPTTRYLDVLEIVVCCAFVSYGLLVAEYDEICALLGC